MLSFARNFLEPFSYLIYVIALIVELKRNRSNKIKVLLIYYIVAIFTITYACFIALDYNDDNNWLYNIHYLLSTLVIAYYFYNTIIRSKERAIITILYCMVFINFIVTDLALNNTFFNSFSTAFFFLCVVISTIIYFYQLVNYINEKNALGNFNFWLISGYLLYFLGSFFIILTYKYFTDKFTDEQRSVLANLWAVQNLLLFISSLILIIYQLWKTYQKKSP